MPLIKTMIISKYHSSIFLLFIKNFRNGTSIILNMIGKHLASWWIYKACLFYHLILLTLPQLSLNACWGIVIKLHDLSIKFSRTQIFKLIKVSC